MTVREFYELCEADIFIVIRHPRYDEDGNFMEYYAEPNTCYNDAMRLKIPGKDLNRRIVGIGIKGVPGANTAIVLDTVKGDSD